jgi:hypothetical protein
VGLPAFVRLQMPAHRLAAEAAKPRLQTGDDAAVVEDAEVRLAVAIEELRIGDRIAAFVAGAPTHAIRDRR